VWSEKYRPTEPDQLVGNEEARLALSLWLTKWKPGAKAALLVGPPGTGKTTFVNLLARSRGMNLVELNASDARTKDRLRAKMGEAMATVSLFGERPVIFLDEVDGLAGRSDYGAVEFIKDSVKESQNPIVMAANDPDSDEVKKLASSCVVFRFRPPPPREVEMYLR
jgi:replication factor C large subunit